MAAFLPACLAAQAVPAGDALEALVRDSPFAPAAGAARASAPGAAGPLEFRGVVFEDGRYLFSVYDQTAQRGWWVTLGEEQPDLPFVARSYDRERDLLTVEHQGRSVTLELQAGHVAGSAAPPAEQSPPPLPNPRESAGQAGPTPANPPVPANAQPAEGQRLQELADELRRRRQHPINLPGN